MYYHILFVSQAVVVARAAFMMESLKIEAKRIQLDLLKEDVKTLEKNFIRKVIKVF